MFYLIYIVVHGWSVATNSIAFDSYDLCLKAKSELIAANQKDVYVSQAICAQKGR